MRAFRQLVLTPLFLAQGLWVRARALKLPEAAGLRAGRGGTGPALRLLIVGDSSAAGVGVTHQDQALAGHLSRLLSEHFDLTWRLEARTGATTCQTRHHLERCGLSPVDVVVQALGVNDVTGMVPLSQWLADQGALARLYTERLGARRVYRSGVPPMGAFPALPRPLRGLLGQRAQQFDTALKSASTGPVCHLAFDPARLDPDQMAADGFHPGAEIYAIWAQELADRIVADFASIT